MVVPVSRKVGKQREYGLGKEAGRRSMRAFLINTEENWRWSRKCKGTCDHHKKCTEHKTAAN